MNVIFAALLFWILNWDYEYKFLQYNFIILELLGEAFYFCLCVSGHVHTSASYCAVHILQYTLTMYL